MRPRERQRKQVVHGTNRELIVKRCVVCRRWIALRVDAEDLARHEKGVYVQDAMPYLPPQLRELWISGVCGECWPLLCGSNMLDYD